MDNIITPSPNNSGWAMWKDPDDIVWELRYIVTQFEFEGPEYLEGRPFYNGTDKPREWIRIDDEDLTEEVITKLDAFFHGEVKREVETTHIEPRSDWYSKGDYIAMVVDEGSENMEHIRAAQLQVVEEEQRNSLMLMSGEDKTGHTFPSGPYLWTTWLLDSEAIAKETAEEAEWHDRTGLVIAISNGGDSAGFGYLWILNTESNEIHMTEDPKGSRVKVGVVDGVPASVLSDIERIDEAIESYDISADGETVNVALAMDALHDARHGLLYLVEKLKDKG